MARQKTTDEDRLRTASLQAKTTAEVKQKVEAEAAMSGMSESTWIHHHFEWFFNMFKKEGQDGKKK
jgi:hypothetical protein